MSANLAMETLRQFRIIIGAVRQHFHTVETACGVSGAQVWILSVIAEHPGITVSHLSEALSVHISTASNLLEKLAKAKLVERRRSKTDRRVVKLHLTHNGQEILKMAPGPLAGLMPHALSRLPENVLARLHADLNLLIEQMNDVDLNVADRPLSALVK